MLKKVKSFFNKNSQRKKVAARFDAAQTTRENIRHWSMTDYLSADEEASPEVRQRLRLRSRYEVSNNSYAKGLVQMLANDTIGTGARLQVLTDDEAFNDTVENAFSDWADAIGLSEKLRLMRVARCQDGESFGMLGTNPKVDDDVKLDLTLIEADRVAGDLVWLEDDTSVDGIKYDSFGNPVTYRVLKYHPGDARYATGEEAKYMPAKYMLHIFRSDRPELHRGIPELTAALPLFAQLRRYGLAVLTAAEVAADYAAILYTDAPPHGEADEVAPMDSIQLERNMLLTMPAGWRLEQLDAKHPTDKHSEFVKIILSEIARCVVCTYGTLAGDFSGHNYASGRLDNQLYQKSILVDRTLWERKVLNRIFKIWYQEFVLVSGYAGKHLKNKTPRHTWFWDGFLHVDPTKEATAQEIRLANNTTTLAAECAKDGRDYMSVLRQRAKELKLMRELGISNISENSTEKNDDEEKENEEDG